VAGETNKRENVKGAGAMCLTQLKKREKIGAQETGCPPSEKMHKVSSMSPEEQGDSMTGSRGRG